MARAWTWPWVLLLGTLAGGPARGAAARPPTGLPAAEGAQGPRVAVTPARDSLQLGADRETQIAVDVVGPDAESYRPLRVLASVGAIEPMVGRGAGHFTARYVAPSDLAPRVALIAFELSNGTQRIHGWTRLPLVGSTVFPLHTNSGASVTMRVAGRVFGPALADKQGHVEIPITVPPGAQKAEARAVDRSGESRETEVDLHLPPFPRLLMLAPDAVEVGSLSEVSVLAVDERGAPQMVGVSLVASAGLAHALGGEAGEVRFLFEAPTRAESPRVALTASAAGAVPSRADASVALRAATPDRIEVDAASDRLIVGDPSPLTVTIWARDRFGNRTALGAATAFVDGRPQPLEATADGTAALFRLSAPAHYTGRDRMEIAAQVGGARTIRMLRVTGGAPAALAIRVAPGRVVADGRRGTELRVQAIDRNGTPTSVPGLSWETPEGRIRGVRVPRDGEYLAEYVPDRTREAHRELVAVMASESVRAETLVDVSPPPIRVLAAARAGLVTSFGPSVGPAVFVEALAPLRLTRVHLFAGVTAGYLHGDLTGHGVEGTGASHIEMNQVPLLGLARAGITSASDLELAAEVAAGWSFAWLHVTENPSGASVSDLATANAPALGGGLQLTYPLRPGRLALGLRYLWIDLGETSLGDHLSGNSAGLVADLGYEMTF